MTNRNDNFRTYWNDYISNQRPYDIFSTLTFAKQLTDAYAIKSYNFLLHQLSKTLFGQRYKRKMLFNEGFVFAERQVNGNLHFHSIIKFHQKLSSYQKDCYEGIYRSCAAKLTAPNRNLEPVVITDPQGIDIQPYDNNLTLIDYLTKAMKYENKNIPDSISPISINGIDLLDLHLKHLHT